MHISRGVLVGLVAPAAFLVVDPGGWFAFGPAKWAAVSTVVLLAAAAVPWSWHQKLDQLFALLVGWLLVCALVGPNRVTALLGTPERHLGVVGWAIAGLALVVGHSLGERGRKAALGGLAVAGFGVGLAALAEALGADVSWLQVDQRLTATFGSAAYLGAACALALPALVGLTAEVTFGRATRFVSGGAAGLIAIALVGSGARAAWVGTGLAAIALGVAQRERLGVRRIVIGAAAAIVVVVAIAALSPAGSRAAAITDSNAPGGRGRIDEWRVATRVIEDHLLVGVGPEGYRTAFAEGADDDYEHAHGRVPLPDRAHAAPLDIALAGGLPALGLWAALLITLLRRMWRAMHSPDAWRVGVAAGVIGYFAAQLFLFPIGELDPVVWLLAGLLVSDESRPIVARASRTVVLALLAAIAAVAGVLDVAADHDARAASDALARGDAASALSHAQAAVSRRPDEVRLHLLESQALVADQRGNRAAIAAVDDALRVSPRDPVALLQRARLLVDLAAATTLPSDRDAARAELDRLLARDPHRAALHALRARVALLDGDADLAAAERARAMQLRADDPDVIGLGS